MKTAKYRFVRLLFLANAIAKRDGAELDQRLTRLTIALFLKQEREIYSDDNRYYAGIAGRDPQDIANLVDWWTEQGEDEFWARRKNVVRRIRTRFSPDQCTGVRNAVQGALAFEDEHRHFALREWRHLSQHDQKNFKLWVILHALACMASRFERRFTIQQGGIFP